MYRCRFCTIDWPSRQSFNAHCKGCKQYLKHKGTTALGSRLRAPVPKAQSHEAIPDPLPSSSPQSSDPMATFKKVLQNAGLLPSHGERTQETLQQKRRRLLQAAKTRAIEHYWPVKSVTVAMRAEARLAMDRELRDEPLEEFTFQEVNELTEGIRERVYTLHWHRQEEEERRIQEGESRTRATQRDQDRTQTERTRKKVVFLDEARRRAVNLLKTRALPFLQRLQALENILTQLDAALTGDESLFDAYASIDAVLQARVAEWDAAQAARQQKEWWEIGVAIFSLWCTYAKGPEILLWLWKILSPEPAEHSEHSQQPHTEAPPQTSEESISPRPAKRIRRPSTSPATESTSPPPYTESENRSG